MPEAVDSLQGVRQRSGGARAGSRGRGIGTPRPARRPGRGTARGGRRSGKHRPGWGSASALAAWGDVGAVVWPAVVRGAAGRQRTGSRSVGEPERRGRGGMNSGRKEPGARLSLSRKSGEQ